MPSFTEYSLFDQDKMASSILDKCPKRINNGIVDIESIIPEYAGIRVECAYGLKRQFDTWAYISVSQLKIFIDASLMDTNSIMYLKKYRFTLAEELAHFLLHKDIYKNCNSAKDRLEIHKNIGDAQVGRLDRQAKALAGSLLLPKEKVENRMEKLVPEHGIEQDGVDIICRILGREFDVNHTAVRKRLKNLGYHDRLGMKLYS